LASMGNDQTRLQVEREPGSISSDLKAFNENEAKNIAAVSENLHARFPYQTISHETLKQVFPMPMPVAKVFCESLDDFNAEILDFEPMFKWINRYNKGTVLDKADMLFRMFGIRQIRREGKKVMFLVLSILVTPVSLYFTVSEHHNMTPQLTWKQKSFIKKMMEAVFGEQKIEVRADGTFDPNEFLKKVIPTNVSEFEQTLITASKEIKRPEKETKKQTNKEQVRMDKLVKYLNRRFKFKTISFETVLTQFPMPGEFGPQWCKYLDDSHSEIIDFKPLEKWLDEYAKADVYNKVLILMKVYGGGSLGQIPLQELINIFSVLLMPFVRFFPVDDAKRKIEMPKLGEEEQDLIDDLFSKCPVVHQNPQNVPAEPFMQWLKKNTNIQEEIASQLGMIAVKRSTKADPIQFVSWWPEDGVEIMAGDERKLAIKTYPMVKGGNVRFTFNIPEDYQDFFEIEPSYVVIPQNADLSEQFTVRVKDDCPVMPPEINVVATGIEGKPNLDHDGEEFELDFIDIVEPKSELDERILEFLRVQFNFAAKKNGYLDFKALQHFMLMGHPNTSDKQLQKGTETLVNKFGIQGKVYWRGFLKFYERTFQSDKKAMGAELTGRGFADKSKSEVLPLPLYQFLLYNYQYFTVEEGLFTSRSLKDFMQVGYPNAPADKLQKGSKRAIQKYGEEVEGEEDRTTLNWDGFLKLYEDSYSRDPGALQKEFENRGFTLHQSAPATPKPKVRRVSRQDSRTSLAKIMPPSMRSASILETTDQGETGRFETVSFRPSQPKVQPNRPNAPASPRSPATKKKSQTDGGAQKPAKKPSGCCVIS